MNDQAPLSQQNPVYAFQPRYQEYEHILAAGDVLQITTDSDFVNCLSADFDFKIRFDNAPESTFKAGLKYIPGQKIKRVTIRNNGALPNTINLAMGRGDIVDARLNLSGSINASKVVSDVFKTGAAVSALATASTLLLASNPNRKEAIVQNEGSAKIYLRDTNLAAVGGISVGAGQSVILETTAALYAYNPDAAAQSVLASELELV